MKLEPESYLDDMVTCSQIVYNFNPEKTKKVQDVLRIPMIEFALIV